MATKKTTAKRPTTHHMSVYSSLPERAQFTQAARRAGLSLSGWLLAAAKAFLVLAVACFAIAVAMLAGVGCSAPFEAGAPEQVTMSPVAVVEAGAASVAAPVIDAGAPVERA